jgi:hypothetical protein
MKKSTNSKYTDSVNTRFPTEVARAIKSYCEEEGIKPPVLVRKAVVKYLKEKDVLKGDKKYL